MSLDSPPPVTGSEEPENWRICGSDLELSAAFSALTLAVFDRKFNYVSAQTLNDKISGTKTVGLLWERRCASRLHSNADTLFLL